uniref:C2H2-type domain-containing protein n=1 Tax=Sphaeramia orbicularis TaxID=375764 RepID=A0A673C8N4_9TELE
MQNQTATQESPVQTFQCSQCVLIFKSRPYLFDHLTKVHGSDVDSALKYTGLKGTGTPYSCQDCNFKHSDWTFFTEHKKECPKSNQLKEDGKAKGVSHTKTKCTVISTKNLKIYKKPSQTITKYFAPLSGSNVKFLEDNPASVDNSKGTLILEESSSNSKPHSSGVFTVTAKSIDIDTRGTSNQFLLNDQLFSADVTHPKPVEQIVTPNPGKRTIKESFTSCPAKQAKIEKVAIKSQPKDPFFSSGLPLPIIKDSDKDLCFCHFCNYRHHDTSRVRQHYFKVHRGFKITSKQIRLHSTDVLEKVQKTYHGRKGNQKKTSKKSLRSFPFSTSVSKTQRTLQCPNCAYATQHVYLLRRHLYKIHKTKYSAGDVLNLCCQQGSLQPGYHCDMCVFSSKEPVQLQEHFGEKHFKLNRSLEYIFQLYNDGQHDSDDPGSSLQFQRSAQKDCKIYSCRACSFRGTSVSSITSHYRAIHPWSVKEDGSVLDVICSKEQTANMQLEDSDEYYKFETYQVPLEFDNSPASSHEETGVFQCSHCSASFHSQHGLIVHCGMKHPQSSEEIVNEQQVENNTRVHIFKCLHCAYVNTRYQGVLTHIQMKHPGLEAKADSLYVDNVHLNNAKMTAPDDMLRFSGYRCKKCSHIFSSQDMLDKHNEKNHKKMPLKIKLKLTPKPLVVNDRPPSHSTQELVLNAASDVQHNEYKCVLCPCSFITATRLGIHYTKKHGKETFLKYYAPMYGQKPKKPALSSPNHSQTQELEHTSGVSSTVEECDNPENTPETTTPAIQDAQYKCHMCSYKAVRRRYLHSHYRKKHKLDLHTVCKLLQKYDRYRGKKKLEDESENGAQVECKECPKLFFKSPKQLIAHYSTFHRSQYILDFTVLAQRSQKNTGVFRCDHCQKKINGIRNLHLHLDRHRARKNKKANAAKMTAATVTTVVPELTMQEKLPTLETVEEFVQRNLKPLETSTVESTLPASPPSLCLTATELEQPEVETSDDKNTCKLCKRSFMSLKGLRSHERSHAALAAIKKLDNLSTSAKIENYLIYKSGTQRPFMCSICSYRTTGYHDSKFHVICFPSSLGSSNTSIQDEENTQSYNEDPPDVSEEINLPESDEETKDALYSEPPDVQRQLNHYHLMAQIGSSSKASLQEAQLPETAPLNCELCNFNSEHLSSMRRHYLHRHGKKIIRCKDCNFFTSLSTFQSGPTHQKDLRCPFCLYQSKNKNNMIDHIILHREERVMPIQVRRPKLSRYLQGIVFRCHKCTFTSASAENLRLHMMRHDDIKPFRCRLCYFDCSRLNDLEAHLCDKHQVVRNHELVGQVSLDMLSAQISRPPEEEEEEELLNTGLSYISGDFADTKAQVKALCSPSTEEKLFTCELCGRSLDNRSELERHVLRHGM